MQISYIPPFMLISSDGTTYRHGDLTSLAMFAWKRRIKIVFNYADELVINGGFSIKKNNEWIVRDSLGQQLGSFYVNENLPLSYRRDYWEKSKYVIVHAAKLGLPIPHTGRRHGPRSYRHPLCIGAYRADAALVVEGTYRFRSVGKINLPPNSWDDIPRKDVEDRSWKRYRRTRWKNTPTDIF